MNKVASLICCLFIVLYPCAVFSAGLERVKANDYYFYAARDAVNRIKITRNSVDLDVAQLSVKVLPVDSFAVYLTFPDGGNMVICLENEISASKLISVMDKIQKETGFMKILGWKPRIDWFVVAQPLADGAASLILIAKKFKIVEFVAPPGVNYSVPDVNARVLENGQRLDLMQVVSPVEFLVNVVECPDGHALIPSISYMSFNFVFAPDTGDEESGAARLYEKTDKHEILFAAGNQESVFTRSVRPAVYIPWGARTDLLSDGRLLYLSDKIPFYTDQYKGETEPAGEDDQKKELTQVREMSDLFAKGQGFFKQEKYSKALFYFNRVLEIDSAHSGALEYAGLSKLKMCLGDGRKYFSRGHWDKSADLFKKALELEPSNKGAQEYLKLAVEKSLGK